MKLTVEHRDADAIMDFLFNEYGVTGDEDYLENELLSDLCSESDIWKMQSMLEEVHDEPVSIGKDLRLILK